MEQSNNKTKIRARARVDARGESGAGQPVPQGPGAGKRPAMPGRGLEAVIWLLAFAPLVLCAVFVAQPAAATAHAVLAGRRGEPPGQQTGISFAVRCGPGADGAAGVFAPHRPAPRKTTANLRGYRVLRLAFALFYLLAACSVPVAALFPGVFRQVPVSRLMPGRTGPFVLCDRQLYAQIPAQLFLRHQSPWALADEENWRRTHRFAGPLWFWGGLGVAVLSFVLPQAAMFAASFAVFLALAVVPFVYSYILYKKAHVNTRGS